jgi:hypothetical protein
MANMNLVDHGTALQTMYFLERDSKFVLRFNMNTKTLNKLKVKIEKQFPLNFQYC